MALSAELAYRVAALSREPLARERLAREFDYHPVFDPITVEPATYYASEEVLQVTIVYEGDEHAINPTDGTPNAVSEAWCPPAG